MNGEYIPFEVTNGEKKGIWQIDVTNLSTLELIKLKEAFKGTTFSPTINGLDRLIYNSIENDDIIQIVVNKEKSNDVLKLMLKDGFVLRAMKGV